MSTCLRKELFIRFTVRVFRDRLLNFVCVLPFLLVLRVGVGCDLVIPDHCLSIFHFSLQVL